MSQDQQTNNNAGKEKNPCAVALGRAGGNKGGYARAAKLTPERRKEIAQQAAQVRWGYEKNKARIVELLKVNISIAEESRMIDTAYIKQQLNRAERAYEKNKARNAELLIIIRTLKAVLSEAK